jgi:hypothetical protein
LAQGTYEPYFFERYRFNQQFDKVPFHEFNRTLLSHLSGAQTNQQQIKIIRMNCYRSGPKGQVLPLTILLMDY